MKIQQTRTSAPNLISFWMGSLPFAAPHQRSETIGISVVTSKTFGLSATKLYQMFNLLCRSQNMNKYCIDTELSTCSNDIESKDVFVVYRAEPSFQMLLVAAVFFFSLTAFDLLFDLMYLILHSRKKNYRENALCSSTHNPMHTKMGRFTPFKMQKKIKPCINFVRRLRHTSICFENSSMGMFHHIYKLLKRNNQI